MITKLAVTYTISRPGYEGRTDMVALTEGYTTVHDVYKMIAIRRNVNPYEVTITLIKEI